MGPLFGTLLAGSLLYILFVLLIALLGFYISYRIIKAAVRDGAIEAINRTGLASQGNTGGFIHGYPPVQTYDAPVPPTREF